MILVNKWDTVPYKESNTHVFSRMSPGTSAECVCRPAREQDSQDSCSADDVAAAASADYTSQHIRTSHAALDQSRCPVNRLHHNLVLCLHRPACEQDP